MTGFHGTLADFPPRQLAPTTGAGGGPPRIWLFTTRRAAREWVTARGGYAQRYRLLRVEYRPTDRSAVVGQLHGERIVHPDDILSVRTVESGPCGID